MKKLTLEYLDTCLPDYFQGFRGQTYAVSLPPRPRYRDVLAGLHFEIQSQEIWLEGGVSAGEEVYESVHQQADTIFKEVDKRKSWSQLNETYDGSYAYFGLKEEEIEDAA